MARSKDETVQIYPTGIALIDNVPAVVQDVTPERAAELLAYQPPAFTTEPPATVPDEPKELSTDG
jgi:hypothetical protein